MPNMFNEIGNTGLNAWNGVIQEEILRELRGVEGYRRYNEMRLNSPVITAMLTAVEHSVRKVTWEVSSDIGDDDPRVEYLDDCLKNIRWQSHVSEALSMLPFGFSVFEIVYYRGDDGRIYIKRLAPRKQDTVQRWLLGDNGDIEGFVQVAYPNLTPIAIPSEKLVLYRTRVEVGNPEGRSILRGAWIPYYYAKSIMKIEGIGIERDLAGMPYVKLPEGADVTDSATSDLGKARKIVRNIRRDEQEGLVIPPGWDIGLMTSGGERQFDTDKVITRYESRMLMSALAQFLLLGQQSVGSFALSSDQSDLFTMSVNVTADIIADTFNEQLLPRLMRLNGWDAAGIKLIHSPAGDVNIMAMADFLQKVGDKITWRAADEVYLRQIADLPEASIEELEGEREAKSAADAATMARLNPFQKQPDTAPQDEPDDEEEDKEDKMTAVPAHILGGIYRELHRANSLLAEEL